jgi:hypothetical protein
MKHFFLVKMKAASLLALAFFCVSCSARISGQLAADASGTLRLQAGLEPNMTALARGLAGFGSGGAGNAAAASAPILDAAALSRSLRAAPGVASAELRNSGQERIEGTVTVNRIGDLLASDSTGAGRFITYTAPTPSAPGRLSVRMDRNAAPAILARLSPEGAAYLSALMAPAATGEALSKTEYLALVESIYGKGVAGEIAAGRVSAAITLPGQVASVKGGASSGREARFDIPLLDILVLETPLDYEITWNRN